MLEEYEELIVLLRQLHSDVPVLEGQHRSIQQAFVSAQTKLENTITDEEKNDRMARLLALQKEITLKKNLPYVDRTERILVDDEAREGEGNYIGRTAGGKLVRFTDKKKRIGEFICVKITKATPFDLFGEALD